MDKGNENITSITNTQWERGQQDTNTDFLLDLPHVIPDERDPKTLSAQDELMRWHLCLSNMPFK